MSFELQAQVIEKEQKNTYLDCENRFLIGALAQLVERNNGIVEVNGSIPLRSISFYLFFLSSNIFYSLVGQVFPFLFFL